MGDSEIIMEYVDMEIDKKLYTLKYAPDTESHLKPDQEQCKLCVSKCCTYICPAKVYEWEDTTQDLIVNYENCLECGACRIACERGTLDWSYPRGTKGVTFKQG